MDPRIRQLRSTKFGGERLTRRQIAAEPAVADQLKVLRDRLMKHLADTGDPRALGKPAPWDYYPYYGRKVHEGWTVDPPPA